MKITQAEIPEDAADRLVCLDLSVRRTTKKLIRMEARKRACKINRKKRLKEEVDKEVRSINHHILNLKNKMVLQVVHSIAVIDEIEKEQGAI